MFPKSIISEVPVLRHYREVNNREFKKINTEDNHMNTFDKQRVENAIWILKQYEDEIREIAKLGSFYSWDCDTVFDVLNVVKLNLD